MADFRCKLLENDFSGLLLNIDTQEVVCRLVGSFNAYNLTAAYATAILLEEKKVETKGEDDWGDFKQVEPSSDNWAKFDEPNQSWASFDQDTKTNQNWSSADTTISIFWLASGTVPAKPS